MKECTKCKQIKPLSYFHKSGKGFKPRCKDCVKEDSRLRYLICKEHITKINKKYVDNNRSKVNERSRKYYHENKKKCNDRSRRWQSKNKEHIRKYTNERSKYRKLNDPIYKLTCNIRSDVHKILQRKTKSTHDYIGCDYDELLKWLNTNDYGFEYGQKNLDIDHIVPLSSANDKEELSKLLHYTNLQLLPSYYNRHVKKDKIFNKIEFKEWLKNKK